MTTIDLAETNPSLEDLIKLAQQGPVVLRTVDGQQFVLESTDDFEQEVTVLRESEPFQQFLAQRLSSQSQRFSLEDLEAEVEQALLTEEAS
jgi:hypothetical protein